MDIRKREVVWVVMTTVSLYFVVYFANTLHKEPAGAQSSQLVELTGQPIRVIRWDEPALPAGYTIPQPGTAPPQPPPDPVPPPPPPPDPVPEPEPEPTPEPTPDPTPEPTPAPEPIPGFPQRVDPVVVSNTADSVKLRWQPYSGVDQFRIFFRKGAKACKVGSRFDVPGTSSEATVLGLTTGIWYFAVEARTTIGGVRRESDCSVEATRQIP